jgi:hypothetical protein
MPRFTWIVPLAFAALTSTLDAQEVAPQAGTWGAEASTDSRVTLLRFRNATSAWLVGFDANHVSRQDDGDQDQSSSSVSLRLGIRGYRNPAERVRPFTGVSALVGYVDNDFEGGYMVFGGSGEVGAAYFFSRHVSLGSAFDLSAVYYQTERADFPTGAPIDVSTLFVRASIRFLGAVYF